MSYFNSIYKYIQAHTYNHRYIFRNTVMPVKPKEEVTGYQGTQSIKTQLGEVGSVGNERPFTGM